MKVFFIASEFEAKYFIAGLKKVSANVYEGDFRVVIMGMGLVNSAVNCAEYFKDFPIQEGDEFINIGIAGSTSIEVKIGEIIQPEKFMIYNADELPPSSQKVFAQSYPVIGKGKVVLASALAPVWGEENLRKLNKEKVHLVDMEGYSFALVCSQKGLNFKVFKGVSDYLVKNSQSEFLAHAKKALTNLQKEFLKL